MAAKKIPDSFAVIAEVQAAILHDALQKAQRIAPTKGAAFDRAAGIKITLVPNGIEIRATDEELFFYAKIDAVPYKHDVSFRLPSQLLVNFVASVPMNTDAHQIKFRWDENEPRAMIIQFGKTALSIKMAMIVGGNFPEWQPEDFATMTEAQELQSTIEQVSWAVNEDGLLSGAHMDGKNLICVNGKSLAAVAPCPIAIDDPKGVTAVLKPIMPLLKNGTDIKIKVIENRIIVALDSETQIRSTVMLQPWPNVLERFASLDLPSSCVVVRQRMIDALNRMLIVVKNENLPRCMVSIKKGKLETYLLGERGEINDSLAVEDQVFTEDHDYKFNPYWLLEALESFKTAKIRIEHNTTKPTAFPFHISDPSGTYQAWVMPMSDQVS